MPFYLFIFNTTPLQLLYYLSHSVQWVVLDAAVLHFTEPIGWILRTFQSSSHIANCARTFILPVEDVRFLLVSVEGFTLCFCRASFPCPRISEEITSHSWPPLGWRLLPKLFYMREVLVETIIWVFFLFNTALVWFGVEAITRITELYIFLNLCLMWLRHAETECKFLTYQRKLQCRVLDWLVYFKYHWNLRR